MCVYMISNRFRTNNTSIFQLKHERRNKKSVSVARELSFRKWNELNLSRWRWQNDNRISRLITPCLPFSPCNWLQLLFLLQCIWCNGLVILLLLLLLLPKKSISTSQKDTFQIVSIFLLILVGYQWIWLLQWQQRQRRRRQWRDRSAWACQLIGFSTWKLTCISNPLNNRAARTNGTRVCLCVWVYI